MYCHSVSLCSDARSLVYITIIIGPYTADNGVTSVPIPCVQVTISALNLQFQPNKLARSVEEAKLTAAEYTLAQIGFPLDGACVHACVRAQHQCLTAALCRCSVAL